MTHNILLYTTLDIKSFRTYYWSNLNRPEFGNLVSSQIESLSIIERDSSRISFRSSGSCSSLATDWILVHSIVEGTIASKIHDNVRY